MDVLGNCFALVGDGYSLCFLLLLDNHLLEWRLLHNNHTLLNCYLFLLLLHSLLLLLALLGLPPLKSSQSIAQELVTLLGDYFHNVRLWILNLLNLLLESYDSLLDSEKRIDDLLLFLGDGRLHSQR
jgi:hypothetical protein